MAEELPQSVEGVEQPAPAQEMEVDAEAASDAVTTDEQPNGAEKRKRKDGDGDPAIAEEEEEEEGASKKQKVETSAEEERMEKLEEKEADDEEGDVAKEEEEEETAAAAAATKVSIGPKEFGSSEELLNYFFKFLHFWTPNLDVNKYEHMMLLDLLKKGHAEPDKKIGGGIQAFQIRYHPTWKSRCFFLVRVDGSTDDFSFRKCVDHILPLPEHLKGQSGSVGGKEHDGKKGGGRGWGGGRGRGGGGGRDGGGGRGGRGRGRRGGR